MINTPTRMQIRHYYQTGQVGYDKSLDRLMITGMSAAEADRYLAGREMPARNLAAVSGAFAPLVKTSDRWPDLVNVEGHLVNPKTDQVFIEKTSKRGRAYLSAITSARRIKKILKLMRK